MSVLFPYEILQARTSSQGTQVKQPPEPGLL